MSDHALDIDGRAVPLQKPAPGEMPDAIDVLIVHRAQDPLGGVPVERRVERGDHPVELGEHLVVDVE